MDEDGHDITLEVLELSTVCMVGYSVQPLVSVSVGVRSVTAIVSGYICNIQNSGSIVPPSHSSGHQVSATSPITEDDSTHIQIYLLGAVHKWRRHFLGSLTPLGDYVSLSSAWCSKLTTSFVNSSEPKTIIFRIQFISIRVNGICVTKGVQLSLVRPTKACFGWIPSNCWIFHHSSSFLMTLGPSSSAFVSFLSYRWLFNVATSFVNGP